MAEKTVFDGDVAFAADEDVRVGAVDIADEIQSEDDGTIAAVLKGDDAAVCGAVLYGCENVGDGDLGRERDIVLVEGV